MILAWASPFKQYYTPHAFENVYIDVMHNHDDKHPAWSESEKR